MHPIRLAALQGISQRHAQKDTLKQGPNGDSKKVSEIYGSMTFSYKEMGKYLSKDIVESLKKIAIGEQKMTPEISAKVAEAAKNWALSHGATHFTHWFQPLTGLTAEKHDAFISYDDDGGVIEKLSGGQLLQSEPDASSFPSGGSRSTFEARGYTAWDSSSPLFITEHGNAKILCIPSVFVSYTGQSLDTKTSLLRSLESLNNSTLEMLKEMGDTKPKRILTTIGCEQEYFLIDENYVRARPDLLMTGRSLLGADMPKGQQLEDHYFGSIPSRIQEVMVDVETELYKLGIPSKTRHNEVAPSQFETAPIFEDANIASDHNMMTMEVLRRVAAKHNFVCLLHEKPFAGINGSGKHNNWSMATDTGENLLEPGKTPHQNVRFLAVLSCVLKAVNTRQVALRASIASHGNDHRLGANEAPPAIISVFLGSMLTQILETMEKGGDLSKTNVERAMIDFGINRLPQLPKDNTDRNRTSPFAFTGNKFEYRAVGSSHAISFPVSVLNAAVAESMKEFTKRLKNKKAGANSTDAAVLEVTREFVKESAAIRFEGNGYSEEWRKEAKSRGLYELLKTPDALGEFAKPEHSHFLVEEGIYSKAELDSLIHVKLEQYSKHLDIEVQTLATLARQYVIPAAQTWQFKLAESLKSLDAVGTPSASLAQQKDYLRSLSDTIDKAFTAVETVSTERQNAAALMEDGHKAANAYAKISSGIGADLRAICDKLEAILPDEVWPLPKYREMLFLR